MKRILACLLALALCVSLSALAEEPEWTYDKTWGYVNGYSGPGGDVVLPAEVNGHPVRVLQSKGLTRREDITSFTASEGLLVLGDSVLEGAKNLTSVSLPQTVQVIGTNCFFNCPALTEITFPASVRLFSHDVLGLCRELKTITFEGPCPILTVPFTTLNNAPKDLIIRVPDDQVEAYRAAFEKVPPEQIQPSGRNALPQPELHAEFTFDPETGTLLTASSEDTWIDVPAQIDGVPVRAIAPNAFRGNDFCYAISLPEGLEEIGDHAFDGLSRLVYAPIPSTVRTIGEEAYALYGGQKLTLPAGLTEISRRAFYQSGLSMNLVIPEGVTRIGEEAFSGTYLYAVNLPTSLTSIGEKAFRGTYLSRIYLENLTLPEIAATAFEKQEKDITVSLPPAAGEAEVAAVQAFFDTLGENFTVLRLEEPNGVYPDSPFAQPAVTQAPAAPEPAAEPTAEPTAVPAEEPAPAPTAEPVQAPAAPAALPEIEGVSLDPADYVATWYSIYYGTGGFTGDPREAYDWQDIMTLNADGTVSGNMGDDLTHWAVNPEDGFIQVGEVDVVLLPGGFLQFNNRISGYMIMSRDPDAVWDPATPMYEDLVAAAQGAAPATPTPEPTAPVAVPVSGEAPGAGDDSIALDTKYVCIRYGAGGYEMDASVLGAELSVVLHADGSLDFIMLGSNVTGLTWTWEGSEAVVDYYGAGQLRFTPGADGEVYLNFMDTITYILAPA